MQSKLRNANEYICALILTNTLSEAEFNHSVFLFLLLPLPTFDLRV